jgi:hypothetical protein
MNVGNVLRLVDEIAREYATNGTPGTEDGAPLEIYHLAGSAVAPSRVAGFADTHRGMVRVVKVTPSRTSSTSRVLEWEVDGMPTFINPEHVTRISHLETWPGDGSGS